MTRARSSLGAIEDTCWYHCVVRCVRPDLLCIEDRLTRRSYDHRRDWIAHRIKQLAGIFAIDVAGYAAMSNHAHVVVRIDRERALGWTAEEVLERWTTLYAGPLPGTRYRSKDRERMSEAEVDTVVDLAEVYRTRLYDLSWFMLTLKCIEYNGRMLKVLGTAVGAPGSWWTCAPDARLAFCGGCRRPGDCSEAIEPLSAIGFPCNLARRIHPPRNH